MKNVFFYMLLVISVFAFVSCGSGSEDNLYVTSEKNGEFTNVNQEVSENTFYEGEKNTDTDFSDKEGDAGNLSIKKEISTYPGDEETIGELFEKLNVSLEKNSQFRYICENEYVIEGNAQNTALNFLEGYLHNIIIKPYESLYSKEECFIFYVCSEEGASYIVSIASDTLCICEDASEESRSEDNMPIDKPKPLAVYSFDEGVDVLADLRVILFREKQLSEYIRNSHSSERVTEENGNLLNNGGLLLKANKLYKMDLDGDGLNEELYIGYCGMEWDYRWGQRPDIVIDGAYPSGPYIYMNGELLYKRVNAYTPCTGFFGIVCFLNNPGNKYIITFDDGPSNDPSSSFYSFSDGRITEAGEVPCLLFEGDRFNDYVDMNHEYIRENEVYCENRMNLIQMWNVKAVYGFDEGGKLKLKSAEFEPVEPGLISLKYPVYACNGLTDEEQELIEPGEVYMDDTDGSEWIHITSEDSSKSGWININRLSEYLPESVKSDVHSAYDLFDGYYAAD